MTKLVRDDLKSAPLQSEHFGYALSSNTALKVIDLYKDLNQNVIDLTTRLTQNLKSLHLEVTGAVKEFEKVKGLIDDDHASFSKVINAFQNSTSPEELGNEMFTSIKSRGYDTKWGMNFLNEVRKVESYMNFFDVMAPTKDGLDRKGTDWVLSLKNWVEKELGARKDWYNFIAKLVNTSYYFEVHSKRPSTVPQTMEKVKEALGNHGDILNDKIMELGNSKEEVLTKMDTEVLWTAVKEIFQQPEIICSTGNENRMTIKGSFIKVNFLQCVK